MTTVNFKNKPCRVSGKFPHVLDKAPRFELVGHHLHDNTLETYEGKIKILNIFPSLDTGVCAMAFKTFYDKCHTNPNLIVLNISMDLPFAASRFCTAEKMEDAVTLSAFRSTFPDDYGVRLTEGPLKGLCARAIILLNKDNEVVYTELVPEITQEPDYNAVLEEITKL